MSAGKKFREVLQNNEQLVIPGAINAYSAKLAEKAGHKAVYLLSLIHISEPTRPY